ncbi:MAG: Gfo/Idh/MocA family protein [Phycisphaerae bacterium]
MSKKKSANRKLRVGMIVAGGISGNHCQGWTRLDGAELVAITDVNKDAALRRAEEFHIETVESDGERLIARDDIDVVDIVTPNRYHKPYTVAALQAKKHVLCEKPLALTAKEVDEMISAAKEARRKLMCAQHMRFQANSLALKRYLADNPLGEVYYSRAWYNRRRSLPARAGFIYKKHSGGGCCIDVGVHILDLAMHLMGNFEPVSVSGLAVNKLAKRPESFTEMEWGCFDKEGMDVEDFAAGIIRFADGSALSLECSFMLNQGPRNETRIDLFGTEAGASWPDCRYYDHTETDYADTDLTVRDTGPKAHHAVIEAFAKSVMDNKPVPVPPEQTRAVIAVLEGLYKSQQRGKAVKLG